MGLVHVVWDLQQEFAWGTVGSMRDLTGLAHAHAIATLPTVAHPIPTWD